MNRLIRFRAWDKEARRMVNPGYRVQESELMLTFSGEITEEHNNHACGDDDCCGPNENYLYENSKQYVLMQFTDLHDKNGKEIYEGDILDSKAEGSRWTMKVGIPECYQWNYEAMEYEIIGNVFENPELISNV
jgi:uncharacterized phage protein (TIGR01671 family)